jgi:hypothetical protein
MIKWNRVIYNSNKRYCLINLRILIQARDKAIIKLLIVQIIVQLIMTIIKCKGSERLELKLKEETFILIIKMS